MAVRVAHSGPMVILRVDSMGGIAMSAAQRIHRSLAVFLAAGLLMLGTGSAAVAATPSPHTELGAAAAVENDGEGPQFYTGVLIDVSVRSTATCTRPARASRSAATSRVM